MKEKAEEDKMKIKKKIVWDEHGVSEIIGDIMILSMTVVLFTSVFIFVYTLETPDEAVYADLVGDIKLDLGGG